MDVLKTYKTYKDSGKDLGTFHDIELLEKTLKNYEETICRQKL